jgi:hypothetical protein
MARIIPRRRVGFDLAEELVERDTEAIDEMGERHERRRGEPELDGGYVAAGKRMAELCLREPRREPAPADLPPDRGSETGCPGRFGMLSNT